MSKRKSEQVFDDRESACKNMLQVLFSNENMSKQDISLWENHIEECLLQYQTEFPKFSGFIDMVRAARCPGNGKPYNFVIANVDDIKSLRLRAAGLRSLESRIRQCGVSLSFDSWEKALEVINILRNLVTEISTDVAPLDVYMHSLTRLTSLKALEINVPLLSSFDFLSSFPNLERLDLTNVSSTFDLGLLKKAKNLRHLRIVGQRNSYVMNAGQSEMLGQFSKLESLVLSNVQLQDDAFKDIKKLTNLKTLRIDFEKEITDRGVAQLEGLQKIEHLSLSRSQVSDESLPVFQKLPALKTLNLINTKITEKTSDTLWKAGIRVSG